MYNYAHNQGGTASAPDYLNSGSTAAPVPGHNTGAGAYGYDNVGTPGAQSNGTSGNTGPGAYNANVSRLWCLLYASMGC